jgi:hypothetical protein
MKTSTSTFARLFVPIALALFFQFFQFVQFFEFGAARSAASAHAAQAAPITQAPQALSFLDSAAAAPPLAVSGFVDAYYALAFAAPPARTRAFTTQPLYHNEFSINFAFLSLAYSADRVRAKFAVQASSYAEVNYAAD